jgi:hypothetical protein
MTSSMIACAREIGARGLPLRPSGPLPLPTYPGTCRIVGPTPRPRHVYPISLILYLTTLNVLVKLGFDDLQPNLKQPTLTSPASSQCVLLRSAVSCDHTHDQACLSGTCCVTVTTIASRIIRDMCPQNLTCYVCNISLYHIPLA